MTEEIHVGDTGTYLRFTFSDNGLPVDLSGATSMVLKANPPSQEGKQFNLALVGNGTDGQAYYITQTDDLDEAGVWELQGEVETPDGKWNSNIINQRVYANL